MRQLHPVSLHEKFLASGLYRYFRDERPTGTEEWTIHELPDGSQLVRVDIEDNFEQAVAITVLIEAWRTSEAKVERFDVWLDRRDVDGSRQARATYMISDNHLQVIRRLGHAESQHEALELPENVVICPPAAFIFLAALFTQAVEPASMLSVPHTAGDQYLLRPAIKPYRKALIGRATRSVDGREIAVDGYRLVDGSARFTEQAVFWVDKYGVVVGYEEPHRDGVTCALQLTRYARRPDLSL